MQIFIDQKNRLYYLITLTILCFELIKTVTSSQVKTPMIKIHVKSPSPFPERIQSNYVTLKQHSFRPHALSNQHHR